MMTLDFPFFASSALEDVASILCYINVSILFYDPHLTLKQESKVISDTCKRFADKDFLLVVFSFRTPRTNDKEDTRPF